MSFSVAAGELPISITVAPDIRDRHRGFFFAVSNPTKASLYLFVASLYFFVVRPPCLRLGSVRPSKPSYLYCTSGRASDLAGWT
jgi:hypothetical protein